MLQVLIHPKVEQLHIPKITSFEKFHVRKSMLWTNYDRYVRMMKNIVADAAYKSASNGTQPTASHHSKVSSTFLDHFTDGFTRLTTTQLYLKVYLKSENAQPNISGRV